MRKVTVMLARFPYQNQECPDSVDWYVRTVLKAKADPRVERLLHTRVDDTPITMGRNRVCRQARDVGADYLLMLDSDMAPDLPGEDPFWDTAFDFAYWHPVPCVVAAPYCGPPPFSNVYVFRWANRVNDHPDLDARLEPFSREEAARLAGVQPVAALPTGLILFDVRALDALEPPYFSYEWTDRTESEKASTEDVVFTRDLSLAGVPLYCAWSCWAGHWKRWRADKPRPLCADQVGRQLHAAVERGRDSRERLVRVGRDGLPPAANGMAANGAAAGRGE